MAVSRGSLPRASTLSPTYAPSHARYAISCQPMYTQTPMVLQQMSQSSQHQSTARIRVPSGSFGIAQQGLLFEGVCLNLFRPGWNDWNGTRLLVVVRSIPTCFVSNLNFQANEQPTPTKNSPSDFCGGTAQLDSKTGVPSRGQRVLLTQRMTFHANICLLYTSPSPRDQRGSRMPSSA